MPVRGNVVWTPQRLAWTALAMTWDATPGLVERFESVGESLRQACPHWKLGTSYEGWVQALHRETDRLIPAITRKFRRQMEAMGAHRRYGRWEVIAVDGSDGACPRTAANQQAMGDTGRPGGMPQLSMTTLHHVALDMPWAFRVGPGSESERQHLRSMLPEIPRQALLVGDAGFVGYDLCREMLETGQHFLLRVGGNVHLLKEAFGEMEIQGDLVYLWPLDQQGRRQPPLKLRLITIEDAGHEPLYLVTSVLDPQELTLEEARAIYQGRWGVEVGFRTIKQTLGHDGVQSRTPENCYLEMQWTILGAWMLALMTVQEVVDAGGTPREASPAAARDVVRRAMRNAPPSKRRRRKPRRRRGSRGNAVQAALAACRLDRYTRKRPKDSRGYPRKKRHEPPSAPKIKSLNDTQRQLAHELTPITIAT